LAAGTETPRGRLQQNDQADRKDDILDYSGAPDEIVDASQAMRRRAWQCDACGDVINSDVPIRPQL
jgi:hypothetical protein